MTDKHQLACCEALIVLLLAKRLVDCEAIEPAGLVSVLELPLQICTSVLLQRLTLLTCNTSTLLSMRWMSATPCAAARLAILRGSAHFSTQLTYADGN